MADDEEAESSASTLENPREEKKEEQQRIKGIGLRKFREETTEIYRIPFLKQQKEDEHNFLISRPASWAIELIALQIKIVLHIFHIVSRACGSLWAMVTEPVHRTAQAKNRAAEKVSQNLAMISQVSTEGGGIVMRKLGFGCLAAAYVFVMLTVLMFFAALFGVLFVRVWVEEPVIIRRPLYFDYTERNPSALLDLSSGKKIAAKRVIPAGHKFTVTVNLVLPESNHNREVGIFQVMAELISGSDKVLARSSQPCMLPYKSAPVRLAKTFLMGLPLLMGILGETQTLVINLIDYQEKNIPTESLKLILQPKAGASALPELYSSEVFIRSQLPWVKEFTRNWKWTFYVWNTLAFYFLLVGLIICCCKHVLLFKSTTGKPDNKKLSQDGEELHNAPIDSTISESGRRHSRSRNKPHVSFAKESPLVSLEHSPLTADVRHEEQEETSEIIEESVIDGKNKYFSSRAQVTTEHE